MGDAGRRGAQLRQVGGAGEGGHRQEYGDAGGAVQIGVAGSRRRVEGFDAGVSQAIFARHLNFDVAERRIVRPKTRSQAFVRTKAYHAREARRARFARATIAEKASARRDDPAQGLSSQMITLFTAPPPKPTLYERFKTAVSKTRDDLVDRIDDIFQGRKVIDEELLEELEMTLISADLGVRTTDEILEEIRRKLDRKQLSDPQELKEHIAQHMIEILERAEGDKPAVTVSPRVILVVGVNGTGKTTTIGKLAKKLKTNGEEVLLAAADTFRAAAIEQLEVWSERTGVPIIKQKAGADPSAVVYDALEAAKSRKADVVVVDTAGRLHNKAGLMAELDKIKRTAGRLVEGAPHETLLVLDAVTGQNGLEQARQFTAVAGVTGLVLTKLDGTAKGGIAVAIARELNLPIRYVGVGEKVDDLEEFDPESFVRALFEIA
ncbi:MAG: signal recognition particle-docking protein FtsY [Bryobacterales bacterium]|nr:signal recognition particle-docking protein FtsY [Bryobacterales bacterium]